MEHLNPHSPYAIQIQCEFVPLSHRQGNCIPYAAIRWHDFGNRPALGRPLGHFLAIQTHLSCRFLLAVDSLGLTPDAGLRRRSSIKLRMDPEQVPRHRHLFANWNVT